MYTDHSFTCKCLYNFIINFLIHSVNLYNDYSSSVLCASPYLVHLYHILPHLPLPHCLSLLLCFTLG